MRDQKPRKKVVLVGLYLPGIYPPGKDDVVAGLLSVALLKGTAEADPEIASKYDLQILDITTTTESTQIAARISELEPDIVAYSVYIWNYDQVVESLDLIKKNQPNIKVLFGGPLVSYTPKEMLIDNPNADIIVCGSGEGRFTQLLKSDFSIGHLRKIPRIAFWDETRSVEITKGEVHEDLSKIPFPYHNKVVDLNDGRKHTVFLETYRGCPFECGYCIWGEPDKSLYKFPMESILNEIEVIFNSPNVEAVLFTDACLFYTRERAKQIIDKIASCSRGKEIMSVLTLDILVVNEEMIKSLNKIDLFHGQLHFGLQSTNPKALELLKRKSGAELFKRKIEMIRSIDPNAKISFDLIYGLPGDNFETFRESVNFTMSLRPGKLYFSPLLLLPGTPFWDEMDKFGFDLDLKPPYMVRSNNDYSAEDMEKTFRFVLWMLTIMYVQAIRDAFFKISDYRPELQPIDLIDRYIEILSKRIDPVSDCECIDTIEANNDARRHVMDVISEPENILHAYEAALELLHEFEVEVLSEDVKIGIDYYRSVSSGDTKVDADFNGRYDHEKIEYIKTSWVTA
jgi:radical SAM superfamily enzyme YgiQ (UPF0313 family)